MRIKKTVYPHDFTYARENGELDKYNESVNINRQCAEAIYEAINKSNYATNHYNLREAAQNVIETYGIKRVTWLLATTVNLSHNDGRYSTTNKNWAKGFDTLNERSFNVRSHPCLVDGIINHTREICAEQEQARAAKRQAKPSLIGQVKSLSAAQKKPGSEALTAETRERLEKAVEFIVKTCAEKTHSGTYLINANDIPSGLLTPELFAEHQNLICDMMMKYESVALAEIDFDAIDATMHLDFCPNYEPTPEEMDEYPDNRVMRDPLTKTADNPERNQTADKPKKRDGLEV